MILLPGLLFILWGEAGLCLTESGGFTVKEDIRHFAVTNDTVYIATEEKLYQLRHDLTLVQGLTQRGILKGGPEPTDALLYRVSEPDKGNVTFSVNVLLPFVENGTVIVCGMADKCGYCELLDLKNISNVLYRERIEVGSPWNSSASVSFLVNVEEKSTETYILTAIQKIKGNPTKTICSSNLEAVTLRNTNNKQTGEIFSSRGKHKTTEIKREDNVEFVDGFQINSVIYLFSNVPSSDESNKVRLIWLEGKTGKTETLESLRGATLRLSDGDKGSKLLASSVIPGGPPVLWSGVFSVDGGQTSTELVVFDISPDLTGATDVDPDFCSDCPNSKGTPKTLKPKTVVLRQRSMSSVLAVRQKAWVVFFIGTEDGQLIKVCIKNEMHLLLEEENICLNENFSYTGDSLHQWLFVQLVSID